MDSSRGEVIDKLLIAAQAANVRELREATEFLRTSAGLQLSVWPEETESLPLVRRFAQAWLEAADGDQWERAAVWRDMARELADAVYSAQLPDDLGYRIEALIETIPGKTIASRLPWWRRAVDWAHRGARSLYVRCS